MICGLSLIKNGGSTFSEVGFNKPLFLPTNDIGKFSVGFIYYSLSGVGGS